MGSDVLFWEKDRRRVGKLLTIFYENYEKSFFKKTTLKGLIKKRKGLTTSSMLDTHLQNIQYPLT